MDSMKAFGDIVSVHLVPNRLCDFLEGLPQDLEEKVIQVVSIK